MQSEFGLETCTFVIAVAQPTAFSAMIRDAVDQLDFSLENEKGTQFLISLGARRGLMWVT